MSQKKKEQAVTAKVANVKPPTTYVFNNHGQLVATVSGSKYQAVAEYARRGGKDDC
jgi:hypothetical protein